MAAVNAALEAFGKANAIDLAPVRVNVIAPGLSTPRPTTACPAEIRQGMFDGYAAVRARRPRGHRRRRRRRPRSS